MERVDAELFYDRDIVGVEGAERRGHRGVAAWRFFARDDPLQQPHFLHRVAGQPWKFAAVVFGFGFFAVFVRQANIFIQIILGAPIFEEMVKFGLALLLSLGIMWLAGGGRLRAWQSPWWLFLRLPIALAVGAGFGFLEHATTYSAEPLSSYIWRVAFHALSAGASMIAFQAVLPAPDQRTRWLSMVPSVFLHYVNNYLALVLGLSSIAFDRLAAIASVVSSVVVVTLGLTALAMLVVPTATRWCLEQLTQRLPPETKEA